MVNFLDFFRKPKGEFSRNFIERLTILFLIFRQTPYSELHGCTVCIKNICLCLMLDYCFTFVRNLINSNSNNLLRFLLLVISLSYLFVP